MLIEIKMENTRMKSWTKPEVREVGAAMEVTAYAGSEEVTF